MVFSSISFLYYFLPLSLIIYFLSPNKLKNTVIFFVSLIFYAWGEPKFVFVMLITLLQGYVFGRLIENNSKTLSKIWLTTSILFSILILCYFKYTNFFIENINNLTNSSIPKLNITLPIGISFYTFQILSYIIDVYRKTVPAQKNFIDLGAYITMFPQLIAGPIVRYSDISKQLKHRTHSINKAAAGIRRFIIGLSKKVLIADLLGKLCSVYKESTDKSTLFFWVYAIAFTLHIYFDFSGYSDMAIGLGKIFGFEFSENFNYPYISNTITNFWRRWHISLGTWFKDYVYIPLGGNRVNKSKLFFNILTVWILTGFWHGADWNFIIWGLYFGIILIIEKLWLNKLLSKTKIINHIYVLFIVIISFVIFDSSNISELIINLKSILFLNNQPFISPETIYYFRSYILIFIIASVGATPLPKIIFKKLKSNNITSNVIKISEPFILIILLCFINGYILDNSFSPFLYFRF